MKLRLLLTATLFLSIMLWAGCDTTHKGSNEDHSGHAHNEKSNNLETHAGHDHETEDADEHHEHQDGDEHGDEHGDEGEIIVKPDDMKMAGITTARVETGKISTSLEVSGEIGFNEDRVVHITPRFPGIVKEVRFKIGEYVNAGETVAVIESNESMTTYSLKAPISGRIIEKHASAGEHVSEEESMYLLADLSTVWVNLAVYPKDAGKIKQGLKVTIVAVGSESSTMTGTLSYVTPIMDAQTRKITARAVLSNATNTWRPGTFVNATVEIGDGEPGLVVDRNAIQNFENKSVVFIQHESGVFKPVPVTTGEKNSHKVMILSGLEEGQEYVNNGAFDLKAKIVTSSMGAHAGHNH